MRLHSREKIKNYLNRYKFMSLKVLLVSHTRKEVYFVVSRSDKKECSKKPPSTNPPIESKKEKELMEQIEKTKAQLDRLKASLAELDK